MNCGCCGEPCGEYRYCAHCYTTTNASQRRGKRRYKGYRKKYKRGYY